MSSTLFSRTELLSSNFLSIFFSISSHASLWYSCMNWTEPTACHCQTPQVTLWRPVSCLWWVTFVLEATKHTNTILQKVVIMLCKYNWLNLFNIRVTANLIVISRLNVLYLTHTFQRNPSLWNRICSRHQTWNTFKTMTYSITHLRPVSWSPEASSARHSTAPYGVILSARWFVSICHEAIQSGRETWYCCGSFTPEPQKKTRVLLKLNVWTDLGVCVMCVMCGLQESISLRVYTVLSNTHDKRLTTTRQGRGTARLWLRREHVSHKWHWPDYKKNIIPWIYTWVGDVG